MSPRTPKTYKHLTALFFAIAAAVISPFGIHVAYAAESVIGWMLAKLGSAGEGLAWIVAMVINYLIYVPSSWILSASAFVFDRVVPFALGLGTPSAFQSPFITEGWGLMRDITNMVFIFAMLYIAIATILQLGAGRNTKALIINIIIIALFVNFSLFLAQVVIDGANLLAYEFYKALAGGANGHGLAAIFLAGFNPQQLLGMASFDAWITQYNQSNLTLVALYLFGGVVQLVAAYMIFWAAFLFIGRIIVLWILMIVSPLAFAAYIIPGTQGYFKKWWDRLLNQAFVAPIFLFFFFIFALFIQGGLGTFLNAAAAQAGQDGVIQAIFKVSLGFSLVVAFMVIALNQTKKFSGEVAGYATQAVGFSLGAAASMVAGPAGAARLQKLMGAVGAPTAGMGAGVAVGRVTGVPLRPLREKALGATGEAAKKVVEAGTKKGPLGTVLRGLGIARGAAQVEAGTKAKAKADIEKAEKDLEGLSNEALRTEYGRATITEETRAAIIKILGKRKKLQPQAEGEGPMTHDSIVKTLETVKERGYDTEKEVEDKYLSQYAETPEEKERAAKKMSVDAFKEIGKTKRKVSAKDLSPEELKKIGEARGKEVAVDEELELPSNFFDTVENADGTKNTAVFDTVIKNLTSAHFKILSDPEVRGDFSDNFYKNLRDAFERAQEEQKKRVEELKAAGKPVEEKIIETIEDYFKVIGNSRGGQWAKDPETRNVFDTHNIPYKKEKTQEEKDKEKAEREKKGKETEEQKKKGDEEQARKEKEKFYQEFYGGGENKT